MHLEFQNITSMLAQNGFPVHIIQNQIRKFLDKKHQVVQNKNKKICNLFSFDYHSLAILPTTFKTN